MTNQQRRIILIVGGALVLFIFAASIFSVVSKIGKVELTIVVAPDDATLYVDNHTTSPGKIYVTHGSHTLKATKQNFADATQIIDTDKIDTKQTIYLLPKPVSTDAQQYLIEHPDVQQQREHAGDLQADQIQKDLSTKFPIIKQLPYESIDFKVDYGLSDNNTKINFVVTLYPFAQPDKPAYKQQLKDFKQEAVQWIQKQGVDVSQASFTYTPNPE